MKRWGMVALTLSGLVLLGAGTPETSTPDATPAPATGPASAPATTAPTSQPTTEPARDENGIAAGKWVLSGHPVPPATAPATTEPATGTPEPGSEQSADDAAADHDRRARPLSQLLALVPRSAYPLPNGYWTEGILGQWNREAAKVLPTWRAREVCILLRPDGEGNIKYLGQDVLHAGLRLPVQVHGKVTDEKALDVLNHKVEGTRVTLEFEITGARLDWLANQRSNGPRRVVRGREVAAWYADRAGSERVVARPTDIRQYLWLTVEAKDVKVLTR